jgi:hypothetical protein
MPAEPNAPASGLNTRICTPLHPAAAYGRVKAEGMTQSIWRSAGRGRRRPAGGPRGPGRRSTAGWSRRPRYGRAVRRCYAGRSRRPRAGGRVMPPALGVELYPGGVCSCSDLVSDPVRVPRPGVGTGRWRTGRRHLVARLRPRPGRPGLVQIVRNQQAGVSVDGEPAVLVGLGGLTDALTAADDVVEGDVHQAPVDVDVADLQPAQLAAAHAGDHHQPQVQA